MTIVRFFFIAFMLVMAYSIIAEVFYYQKLKMQFAELAIGHIEEDVRELAEDVETISLNSATSDLFQQMYWVQNNNKFVEVVAITSPSGIYYTTNAGDGFLNQLKPLNLLQASATPVNVFDSQHFLHYQVGGEAQPNSAGFTISIKPHFASYQSLLNERLETFLLFFVLVPILGALIFMVLVKRHIITPLNRLESFALNQKQALANSLIAEFNAIYISMKQAFNGLEQDKQILHRRVRSDSLTGLPNRLALKEYLAEAIVQVNQSRSHLALLFLDFDDFKFINDSLGHDKGDEIVVCAAKALQAHLPSQGFIARVGGDEFVIAITGFESKLQLERIIQSMMDALIRLNQCCDGGTSVGCSIGISCYPAHGQNYIELMQTADIAMYEAKRLGKGRYHFYTSDLNERVQKNIEIDHSMRQALHNQEFVLYYQPKVDLKSRKVVGAEALLRWIKPNGEVISPADFIPIAELNGFIVQLGEWVLEAAFSQLKLWTKRMPECVLSINVSARQLAEPGFCQFLQTQLSKYQIDPKRVDLEVTEYLFFDHSVDNLKTVNDIRAMGLSISLDDFGTGFSSLSYLKKFHVDQIKIDKSFIDDFDTETGAVFIETIVKMSENLKKHLVAEGVETESQAQYLESIGCLNVQGFFFSKPLPLTEFERYYQKHQPNSDDL